jgi:chloramphenicol-sensitive protein RarD
VPIYFKAVGHVPPLEVLAHRIIWSVVLLVVWLAVRGRLRAAPAVLKSRRTMLTLSVTTALIGTSWYTFIYAVSADQVLQASLGYYINPLVNVLLGFVFLRERLTRAQTLSVLLAAGAVLYLTVSYGAIPWLALLMAFLFGFYGLLRKTARVDSLVGLTVETTLLLPLALGFLLVQMHAGRAAFGAVSAETNVLLLLAGVITALPLLWFTLAARRLRYSTVGLLQYVAPTGHFVLAVALYGEPFTRAHAVAFVGIWAALAIYSVDALRRSRVQAAVDDRRASGTGA